MYSYINFEDGFFQIDSICVGTFRVPRIYVSVQNTHDLPLSQLRTNGTRHYGVDGLLPEVIVHEPRAGWVRFPRSFLLLPH